LKPIDQTGLEYPNETNSFPVSGAETSFNAILDETCGRLEDSRNRGVLKRIGKMEEALQDLEDELEAILRGSSRAAVSSGAAYAGTERETNLL
jgi:hypothetical protein